MVRARPGRLQSVRERSRLFFGRERSRLGRARLLRRLLERFFRLAPRRRLERLSRLRRLLPRFERPRLGARLRLGAPLALLLELRVERLTPLEHRRALRADRSRRLRLLRRPRALRLRLSPFARRLLASGLGERVRVRELGAEAPHRRARRLLPPRRRRLRVLRPGPEANALLRQRVRRLRGDGRVLVGVRTRRLELGLQRPNARVQTRALAPRLRLESLRFRRRVLEAGPRGPRLGRERLGLPPERVDGNGAPRREGPREAEPRQAGNAPTKRRLVLRPRRLLFRAKRGPPRERARDGPARELTERDREHLASPFLDRLERAAGFRVAHERRVRRVPVALVQAVEPREKRGAKDAVSNPRRHLREDAPSASRLRGGVRPGGERGVQGARGDSARHLGAHGAKPRRFVHALDPRRERGAHRAIGEFTRRLGAHRAKPSQILHALDPGRERARNRAVRESTGDASQERLARLGAPRRLRPGRERARDGSRAHLRRRLFEPPSIRTQTRRVVAPRGERPALRPVPEPTDGSREPRPGALALAHGVAPRRHRPRAPPVAHFPGDPTHRRASRFTLGERRAPRLQRGRRPSREHLPRRAQHEPLAPLLVGFALDAPAAVVQRSRRVRLPGGERATQRRANHPADHFLARRPESPRVLDAPRPRREGARERPVREPRRDAGEQRPESLGVRDRVAPRGVRGVQDFVGEFGRDAAHQRLFASRLRRPRDPRRERGVARLVREPRGDAAKL